MPGVKVNRSKMSALARSAGQWALLALAVVGAGIALYLTSVHYDKVPLLCSAGSLVNCERVTSSIYSVVPGTMLPITLPGLAWFVVSALLASVGLRQAHPWISRLEVIWASLGMLVVLALIFAEVVLLHALCIWCTAVHLIILLSLLVAIVEWYREAGASR
jgi:uncharacterized membrane protein